MDKQIQPTPPESVLSKKKMKLLAIAHTLLYALDWGFDNVLYPAILIWLGKLTGMFVLTILSGIICFGLLVYHSRSKDDWLGVDVVEEVKEQGDVWVKKFYSNEGRSWRMIHIISFLPVQIFRLVLWMLKKNDVAAFFALSIYQDAFRTTAFLRHGRKGELSRKDLLIFHASIVLSNLWWTLRWSVIIEFFKWLI